MLIKYCSRQQIEKIIPEDNSILISIAGTKDRFAQIRDEDWRDVLRLRFDDIQRDVGPYRAMAETQANDILTLTDT